MFSVFSHEYYMKEALKEAQRALELDEIPVGAIVVCQQQIIARSHNLTEQLTDVTAHAEILAITSASRFLGRSIYVNAACTSPSNLVLCVQGLWHGVN